MVSRTPLGEPPDPEVNTINRASPVVLGAWYLIPGTSGLSGGITVIPAPERPARIEKTDAGRSDGSWTTQSAEIRVSTSASVSP